MHISFAKSKRTPTMKDFFELEEKLDELEEKFDALCELTGVAFMGGKYDKKAVKVAKDALQK